LIGVRDPEASQKVIAGHISSSLLRDKVFYEKCDIGNMNSVRTFARKVQERFTAIHLLINNAGIYAVPYHETSDGFELQMAVNYSGHFLLTHLLMPQLVVGTSTSYVRVVNVSSCAHHAGAINYEDFHFKKSYHPGKSYANSKLAQVMFSKHLERLCKAQNWNIQTFSAHPGVVDSELFHTTALGSLHLYRKLISKTPEQGARTIVYAAISPQIENQSGSYVSNCHVAANHKLANDPSACEKLLQFTCELLNIEKFGLAE